MRYSQEASSVDMQDEDCSSGLLQCNVQNPRRFIEGLPSVDFTGRNEIALLWSQESAFVTNEHLDPAFEDKPALIKGVFVPCIFPPRGDFHADHDQIRAYFRDALDPRPEFSQSERIQIPEGHARALARGFFAVFCRPFKIRNSTFDILRFALYAFSGNLSYRPAYAVLTSSGEYARSSLRTMKCPRAISW